MNDYILRGMTTDGSARFFCATSRNTVNEMQIIHHTSSVVSAALGRLLTGGAMMGLMLGDDDDLLTISIKGDGPVGGILVTADAKGNVKGYPHFPQVVIPNKANGKLDVSGAIGSGSLTVVKNMGLREPYVGKIELMSGEIAEDLAYYFVQSEQVPSAVALGVLVDVDYSIKQAGGLIVQLLPGADDAFITILESRMQNLRPLTQLFDEGYTPESIIDAIFGDIGFEIMEKHEICYSCNCSEERIELALKQLGVDELEEMIKEDGKAEVSCHFCNKTYHFDEAHLRKILASVQNKG